MIQTYNANRDTNIKDGKVTVSFGFSVEGITPGDARKVEREIDLFLARISAPEKTATGPKQFTIVPWSSDEKATVLPCQTREEAWERFHKRFPDSLRHKATVTRWWDMYHQEPADKLPESVPGAGAIPTNARQEAAATPGNPDKVPPVKKTARQILKEKAPKPSKETRGGRQNLQNKWSPEERTTVDGCKDKDAAIKAYRERFPESKRNDNAIWMKWYSLDRKAKKAAKQKKKSAPAATVQKPAENVPERSAEPDNAVSCFDRQPPAASAELAPKDRVVYTGSPKMFHGTAEVVSAKPGYLNVVVDIGNGRMECNRSNLAKVA